MGYKEFYANHDLQHWTERLKRVAEYLKRLDISGLHYVYHSNYPFVISINCPDHSEHYYATSYLLSMIGSSVPHNSIVSVAHDLKKFHDFLHIWGIDLVDGPPLPILYGFADYLRLIPKNQTVQDSILWTVQNRVILHAVAKAGGTVVPVSEHPKYREIQQRDWAELDYNTIAKTVNTAMEYYKYLQLRTVKYQDLKPSLMPTRKKRSNSLKSATAGAVSTVTNDVRAILSVVGLKCKTGDLIQPFKSSKLIRPQQADWFIQSIPNAQDKLLFTIARFFGPRAAEIANIKIDVATMPDLKNPIQAKKDLRKLKGDLFWDTVGQAWMLNITASKTVKGLRLIPFLNVWEQGQQLINHLLFEALKERQRLLREGNIANGDDHGYLFVSRHHACRGLPITGASILKKFIHLAEVLKKKSLKDGTTFYDLSVFSPHSLRHLFATLLIYLEPEEKFKVSHLMGHSSIEITEKIYFHVFEAANRRCENGIVKDMHSVYKQFVDQIAEIQEVYDDDDDI